MIDFLTKQKSFNDADSIDAALTLCQLSGAQYQVIVSNYTTEVKGPLNIKFVKDDKSKRCFAGFSKVKSDIKKSNLWVDTDKKNVSYYDVSTFENIPDVAYNIDLKSAYATILYNNKMITFKTFKYLSKMSKEDRLACVGMLASHKYIFTYLGKKISAPVQEINSETESFFYFCCEKTFKIMQEIKAICGPSYLFSWVDSVYYTDPAKTKEIQEYLKSIHHKYSYEKLLNLNVTVFDDYFRVVFKKENKPKPTVFSIPKQNSMFVRDVIRMCDRRLKRK